jgi:hypothetical protein
LVAKGLGVAYGEGGVDFYGYRFACSQVVPKPASCMIYSYSIILPSDQRKVLV